MVGASAVFSLLVSMGLAYASESDGGALAPGMLLFWIAQAAYIMTGAVTSPRRRLGLAMVLTGAMIVSLWQILAVTDDSAWKGHLMFLTGAGCFSICAIIIRQSGLGDRRHRLVLDGRRPLPKHRGRGGLHAAARGLGTAFRD